MINKETLLELKDMAEDDPELWWEILDSYLEQVPILLNNMQAALTNQDNVALREAAHNLKGSSFNIGAEGLGEISQAIEQQVVEENLSMLSDTLLEAQNCFNETKTLLDGYR